MNKQTLGVVAVILIAIALFFVFYEQPTMSDQEAAQIIQHQYVKNPTFSIAVRDKGNYYIVGSIADGKYNEPRLLVLKQVADLWQEQQESTQITCGTLDCPSDAKKVKLSGSYYVYFVTESYGSAAGSVTFNLFSPSQAHLYSMSVFGGNGNINQPEQVSSDVQSNKPVYDYLTQQIASSPKIAHTSQQNLDVNSPDNAVQKWQLDNENTRTAMMNYAAPVKFTYYSQNLNDSWAGTSITGTIENSQYKFTAYFKGVVIGLDKAQNKYFVLWVPSDMYEWPTDIAFVGGNTVHINSANSEPSVTINLDNNTITSP